MAGNVDSDEVGFQIAPMVDVVFVLMLFFMASAGSQMHERELDSKLPSLSKGELTKVPIVIEIGGDGAVTMNGKSYGQSTDHSLASLRSWLKDTREVFGDDPVILRPSPDTRHERIVEVLGVTTAAGIKNLILG